RSLQGHLACYHHRPHRPAWRGRAIAEGPELARLCQGGLRVHGSPVLRLLLLDGNLWPPLRAPAQPPPHWRSVAPPRSSPLSRQGCPVGGRLASIFARACQIRYKLASAKEGLTIASRGVAVLASYQVTVEQRTLPLRRTGRAGKIKRFLNDYNQGFAVVAG